ncbi:MAG: hypothetical protein HOE82_12540 [Gammaproteobacteria bacterium]|nr:hypothetical protein [Gammaproteobacteria bacterium]
MTETEQELFRTGVSAGIRTISTDITESLDRESFLVKAQLLFGLSDEEDPEEIAEWAAHGFLYLIASLSFSEATPRGVSDIEYSEADELSLDDFIAGLSFRNGNLCYEVDYLHGRCIKTDICIMPDGHIDVQTRGRGQQLLHWIRRLQGEKKMSVIQGGIS